MAGAALVLQGYEQLLDQLGRAIERVEHPRAMYEAMGASLVTSTQHRFETETDPDGNPWPKSIRVLVEGGRTLTDTTRLRQSITYEASDAGVAVGTNLIYAAIHQFGGVIRAVAGPWLTFMVGGHLVRKGEVTMPRRAFLGLDQDDERELLAIATDFLGEPLGEAA
jgi:phage virion morphogenesis protein